MLVTLFLLPMQAIRASDIGWTDAILVMENMHWQRIMADFPYKAKFKSFHVLDSPNDYEFMDHELVVLIRAASEPIIEELLQKSSVRENSWVHG